CDRVVEVLQGDLGEGCGRVCLPRVVERGVETAGGPDDLVDEALDGGRVGDIGRNDQRITAVGGDLPRDRRQRLLVASRKSDRRAGLREEAGGGGADATARAGDDRDLSFEQARAGPRHAAALTGSASPAAGSTRVEGGTRRIRAAR